MRSGANKDRANKDGSSALCIAAQSGSDSAVKCLLKAGVDKRRLI